MKYFIFSVSTYWFQICGTVAVADSNTPHPYYRSPILDAKFDVIGLVVNHPAVICHSNDCFKSDRAVIVRTPVMICGRESVLSGNILKIKNKMVSEIYVWWLMALGLCIVTKSRYDMYHRCILLILDMYRRYLFVQNIKTNN